MDAESGHRRRDDDAVENDDDDGDNGEDDDSYANAYLDGDEENERNEDDDLAAMFAKVQTIQQAEGLATTAPSAQERREKPPTLDAKILQAAKSASSGRVASGSRSNSSTPTSARRSKSPSAAIARSEDGIKTISRRTLGSAGTSTPGVRIDALLHVKKPAIYEDKLLQTVKSSDLLEKLKTKAVVAAPATIAKRIEDLSAPAKKRTGRKFATDDEERHCRFQPKRIGGAHKSSAFDRDNDDSGGDKRNDFIARMEAAEKSKQKARHSSRCARLEMTRGENEYNARLDKRCCPKCLTPQSYSEYKDKKKRCQMCGVEFRVLQAWGDVGQDFIARMSDATQAKALKQEQIRAHVVQLETTAQRVTKTAKQQFYEKQMLQKNSQRTFLERNYPSSASARSKQTQMQVQQQIQAERAKFMAATCDAPVI